MANKRPSADQELSQQVERSDFFLALVTPSFAHDPKCMMELGTALTTDKPLLLLVQRGAPLPARLRALALYVGEYDKGDTPGLERATEAAMEAYSAQAPAGRPAARL